MTIYEIIASKHGIPEEKEAPVLNSESAMLQNLEVMAANAMKAQYDELLKGLVVDEEAVVKILCKHWRIDTIINGSINSLAKALANSTEIIRREE